MRLNGYFLVAGIGLALTGSALLAEKRYDPGATDKEIKIGNIMPYSGPLSAYGLVGRTEAAYFKKINAEGGINGRKIRFISYDDASNPSKTVEQARRLVEKDQVLLIFQSVGTAPNTAIRNYMNEKKVPQLFVLSGAAKWDDPTHYPWTMGWLPNYQSEGRIYAKYLLENHPSGKIGILYQNDDYGKDYVKGFKDGLGGKIPIVAEAPYDISDPTVDSQIIRLKDSGADIFFDVAASRFGAQAIRKKAELNWEPLHLLNSVSASVGSVLMSAGIANANGTISTTFFKNPGDPAWKNDPAYKDWTAFMYKYSSGGDVTSSESVWGYLAAQALVEVLKRCGDDLSRDNVMKQAASLTNLELGMLLPGIAINTGPSDYTPVQQMQMQRFRRYDWERFGPVITGRVDAN